MHSMNCHIGANMAHTLFLQKKFHKSIYHYIHLYFIRTYLQPDYFSGNRLRQIKYNISDSYCGIDTGMSGILLAITQNERGINLLSFLLIILLLLTPETHYAATELWFEMSKFILDGADIIKS